MTAGAPLLIRSAQTADIEGILDLLQPQEFVKPLTRDQLRSLFRYPWASEARSVALLLMDGDTIGGFGTTIYAPVRVLDGQQCSVVCLGTLFVRPRYRARRTSAGVIRHSEELVRAALTPGVAAVTFSARGPNDTVPRMLLGMGFEEVSSADLFYRRASHVSTLLRPAGTVVTGAARIKTYLEPAQLTILSDHEPYGCRFFLVRQGDEHCFVVTKRRRYRGEWLWPRVPTTWIRSRHFPVSDVLHLSDPAIAAGSWGRLVAHICRADGTVGVTCTESFLGAVAPKGTRLPQRLLVHGRTTSVRSIDKLYTEQVLLP